MTGNDRGSYGVSGGAWTGNEKNHQARFIEEMKYCEIAEQTGMETRTVGIYVQRRKARLRMSLKKRGY